MQQKNLKKNEKPFGLLNILEQNFISNHLPINIKSNISFPTLKISNLTIYFTPDCILMHSNKTFTSVDYAKLEIFDDCEVAIRMETGHWASVPQGDLR